jgi:chromosome segregation ATPase
MALKIQELQTHTMDLEIELTETREKLVLAEATLGSLKRQVEAAELSAKDSADRAQHAEVEFQRVLLSTEEYHEARVKANVEPVAPESRLPPQTSAKTLKESREKAIASVAATDPTGNMLRKWEREGESAEDKLKRLEARLANKGLLNLGKSGGDENKRIIGARRASLASKLNPKSRQNREHLAAKGVMRKKAPGMANAQAKIMKSKLNQKLKYRPNQNDLVKGGILRPGATGRVYGSRNV